MLWGILQLRLTLISPKHCITGRLFIFQVSHHIIFGFIFLIENVLIIFLHSEYEQKFSEQLSLMSSFIKQAGEKHFQDQHNVIIVRKVDVWTLLEIAAMLGLTARAVALGSGKFVDEIIFGMAYNIISWFGKGFQAKMCQ